MPFLASQLDQVQPSPSFQLIQLGWRFSYLLHEINKILDDLEFMLEELQHDPLRVPSFSPEPFFNSMATVGKYE